MDKAALVASFTECEANARERGNRIISAKPDRKNTVGKHEARNYVHLEAVLAEADQACPRAADTIRWLIWHGIVDAQWYMHMAEMLEMPDDTKET